MNVSGFNWFAANLTLCHICISRNTCLETKGDAVLRQALSDFVSYFSSYLFHGSYKKLTNGYKSSGLHFVKTTASPLSCQPEENVNTITASKVFRMLSPTDIVALKGGEKKNFSFWAKGNKNFMPRESGKDGGLSCWSFYSSMSTLIHEICASDTKAQ